MIGSRSSDDAAAAAAAQTFLCVSCRRHSWLCLLRWNQAAQFARRVDVFLRCRRRTAIDLCAALVFRARGSSSSSSSSTTARLIPTGFHLRFDDEPVNSMITQAAGFRRRCVTCPRPSPTDRPSVRPARKIIFSVASPIPSAHCQAAAVRLPSRTVKKKWRHSSIFVVVLIPPFFFLSVLYPSSAPKTTTTTHAKLLDASALL